MDETWQEKLIAHVREHGASCLLSDRAKREQLAFQRKLQAIMDGPIPQAAQQHGALKHSGVVR